ncbi:MAG: UpxY family transcription antiterminator [Bacteroidales bacterium]|nr:UpxY family transcription antiterminator [Bacteroidales bacterium]
MLSSIPQWVALYTNPRFEKKAEQNLKEAGFEVYLPLRKELHSWSDRKKWVEVPLLKSYIFAKITSKQEIPVVNVSGIVSLVKFRGHIATIPEEEIQMMKDFIAAEINVQVQSVERLHRGAKVRIHSGPLAGKVGVLVSDCEEGNFAVEITGISMAMVIYVDKDLMDELQEDKKPDVRKKRKYTIR